MWVLIFNISLYVSTCIYYYNRDKSFSINVAIFALFSLFAFSGYITVIDGIFFKQFGYSNTDNIQLFPYLANYILILALTQSMSGLNKISFSEEIKLLNGHLLTFIECITILVSIIQMIMQYQVAMILSVFDYKDIYDAAHQGESLFTLQSQLENILYFRSLQFINVFYPFIYLIEFSKLSLRINPKKSVLIILLVFLPQIIGSAMMANRGGIIFAISALLFFIIFFWNSLSSKSKQTILLSGIGFIIIIVLQLVAITLSRSGNETDAGNDALRYFGEAFPNLGLRVWEVSDRYIMGARTFPTIYSLFAPLPYIADEGNAGIHEFWGAYSGFPIINFKTFYGDLYCEWGPFLPFLIVGIYIYITHLMRRKLKHTIFSLVIVFNTFMMLIWGLFNANKISGTNMESFLYSFIIAFLLNRVLNNSSKYGIHHIRKL